MKCFVPFSTQSLPSGRALAFIPRRSDPAPGSVIARQSQVSPRMHGIRYRSRWSAFPARRMFDGRATAVQCSA